MQASIGAALEVERRLDDFARARLTPSAAAKARARARVMREARLAFAGHAAAAAAAVELERAQTSTRRRLIRRGAGLALAATLSLVAVGGTLAATTAGGPLYRTRVWLERVALPSGADARANAEIVRLDARLAELEAAVRSGDRAAVAAALTAYQDIADEAIAAAGADASAVEKVLAALGRHLAVLERVADQVPPQAAEAINRNIERAIEHADATIDRIEATPPGPSPNNGVAPVAKPEGTPRPAAATHPPVATQRPPAAQPPVAQPPVAPTAEPTPKPTPKAPPKASTPPRPPKIPPGQSDD